MIESKPFGKFSIPNLKVIVTILLLSSSIPAQEECYGNKHKEISHRILSLANLNANPCTHFDTYACGNFLKEQPWPPYVKRRWNTQFLRFQVNFRKFHESLSSRSNMEAGVHSTAVDKIKRYYASCLGPPKRNVTVLFELLRSIGGWPLASEAFKDHPMHSSFEWTSLTRNSMLSSFSFQSYPLFKIRRTSAKGIVMSKPTFTLGENPDNYELHELYLEIVSSALKQVFGAGQLDFQAELNIMNMMQLERDLSNNSWMLPESWKYTVNQTSSMIGDPIEMVELLKDHFNIVLEPRDELFFKDANYFRKLQDTLRKYDNKTIGDLIAWTMIRTYGPSAITEFVDAPMLLAPRTWTNKVAKLSKWKLCLFDIMQKFKFAMGLLYKQNHVDPKITDIINDLLLQVRYIAVRRPPLFYDSITSSKMIQKLEKMKTSILSHSLMQNASQVDKYYEEYNVGDDYITNLINYKYTATTKEREDGYQDEEYSPVLTGISLLGSENEIQISVTYLQQPVFFPDAPREVHLGTLGAVFGHEMAHSFLLFGSYFNEDGLIQEWWSNETINNFHQIELSFQEMYSSFSMFDRMIDVRESSEENLADAVGIWLAFNALRHYYGDGEIGWQELQKKTELAGFNVTRAQLFFISYAQIWCSEYEERGSEEYFSHSHGFYPIRLRGTLSNSADFASAFNCTEPSLWNRRVKLELFGAYNTSNFTSTG